MDRKISAACLLLLTSVQMMRRHGVEGATMSDLQRLTNTLFSNYSPELRPFSDHNFVTSVTIQICLVSVLDLDEIEQSLTFSAFFGIRWTDPRLSWSEAEYNFTKFFTYPQRNMWIPDVTIANSVQTMTQLGFDRNYLHVQSDGQVMWLPGGVFKTSCLIDVTYYPFDTQTCSIVFTTLVSKAFEMTLQAHPGKPFSTRDYTPSGTWDLQFVTASTPVQRYSAKYVTFELELKRKPTYYVIAIILPVLFLSLTATLVFALPADSGEKMGTSITVLLAFAVYLTIVSDQMPKTSSNVSILSVYLSVLLGQTALGVMMSVWILNLHFRDDQKKAPGPRTRSLALYMQRLMCKIPSKDRVFPITPAQDYDISPDVVTVKATSAYSDDVAADDPSMLTTPLPSLVPPRVPESTGQTYQPEVMTWKEVAFIVDRFLFVTFSFMLSVATLIFLAVLIFQP